MNLLFVGREGLYPAEKAQSTRYLQSVCGKLSEAQNYIFKWGSSSTLYPRRDLRSPVQAIAGTYVTLSAHLGYTGESRDVEMLVRCGLKSCPAKRQGLTI